MEKKDIIPNGINVIVNSWGWQYSEWTEKFLEYGFENKTSKNFKNFDKLDYKVENHFIHPQYGNLVYVLSSQEDCWVLIGADGITRKKPNILSIHYKREGQI